MTKVCKSGLAESMSANVRVQTRDFLVPGSVC